MAVVPKWAQDLTLNALLWWEKQGNVAPNFELSWRKRSTGNLSSGTSWSPHNGKHIVKPRIVVSQGKNRTDAKLVLLHEIAHQLADDGHTDRFWDIAWALYRWAKLPINYCKKKEFSYKRGAKIAYRRTK